MSKLDELVRAAEPIYRLCQLMNNETGTIMGISGSDGSAHVGWADFRRIAKVIEEPTVQVIDIRIRSFAAAAECKQLISNLASDQERYYGFSAVSYGSLDSIDRRRYESAEWSKNHSTAIAEAFLAKYERQAQHRADQNLPAATELAALCAELRDLLRRPEVAYKAVRKREQAELQLEFEAAQATEMW